MPRGIGRQPLRDLDKEVRIEYRCIEYRAHDALVKLFLDYLDLTGKNKLEAPSQVGKQRKDLTKKTGSGGLLEGEGWRDILQLLRDEDKKMEKLGRALKIIQQGILKNNPAIK